MTTITLWRRAAALLLTALALLGAAGCEDDLCTRMRTCCKAIKDVEGVGIGCGKIAKGTRAPETCRSVLETVGYMYQEREQQPPQACQLPSKAPSTP